MPLYYEGEDYVPCELGNSQFETIMANEKDHLLQNGGITLQQKDTVQAYRRRWWILFVVSCVGAMQCLMWNTFGPISHSSEFVLGWTNDIIALILNITDIGYILAVIPFSMLLDSKGLRPSLVISAALLFIGTVLRCLPLEPSAFKGVVYMTAFMCGCAGVVPYGGPSKVAAVWFPPQERTTAAAIVSFANFAGVSFSFLISPAFVADPVFDLKGITSNYPSTLHTEPIMNLTLNGSQNTTKFLMNGESMRSGLSYLMYFQAGGAALLLLLVLAYFPNKPPRPPSRSASAGRTNYRNAFADMARNKHMWLAIVAGSMPRAIVGSWATIIDVPAKALGVSQVDAGWIGFLHSFLGCLAGIFIAKMADMMSGRKKTLILIITVASIIFGGWTAFLFTRVIPFDLGSLYASCVLLGITTNGVAPLFYELCTETAYPVGEGAVGGAYTFILHIIGIIYLSIASIPNQDIDWLTWTVLASAIVTVPIMLMLKENKTRSELDRVIVIEISK